MVAAGTFREDLYYPELAAHLIEKACRAARKPPLKLTSDMG